MSTTYIQHEANAADEPTVDWYASMLASRLKALCVDITDQRSLTVSDMTGAQLHSLSGALLEIAKTAREEARALGREAYSQKY